MIAIEAAILEVVTLMREDANVQALVFPGFASGDFPSFYYGRRLEVAARVNAAKKEGATKNKQFPMVYLRYNDEPEVSEGMVRWRLNVFLVHRSDKIATLPQRVDNVLHPVLDVLYNAFFEALPKVGIFAWNGGLLPKHTRINAPGWGTTTTEGNTKYLFDESTDAIEIRDLELNQRIKIC